jgi:serine/threonine protein kinase
MKPVTCNPDTITNFLADCLDVDQQRTFEQHLDECDHCCAELQQRTASVELWTDTQSFLSSSDNVCHDAPSTSDESTSVSKSVRLDFLAPTDDPHMPGRFGRCEISGVVDCGGMGIVLKGFDPALNRYSAIKVLAPHYASNGAARQRFAREVQAAAAIVHDNVIAIHGVDEFNGLPYLVMPYVKGVSLQKRIDREGPLSTTEILRVALQTARGLAAAHDQGLVHRDIKPANILLPKSVKRVVITDFGLARAADDASLTRSGVIAGTPQYMSPEQARGEGIDTRSDLFSLGSVMYAMCTGHPPFRAETPYGILRRITDNDARPIREVNPDIPAWLCRIVDRLLAKNPDDRFESAEFTAQLLGDCLAHVQKPDQVPLPAAVQSRANTRSNRNWFVAVAVAVLCVVVATSILWPSTDSREMEHLGSEQWRVSDENIENEINVNLELDDVLSELNAELTNDLNELDP